MRIHLGCGKRHFPGFVHVDLSDWPHLDFRRPMQDLSFAEDGTVDLLYCSHALPYLDAAEAAEAMREWFRALRPGGVLRLAVPDFASLCQLYLERGNLKEILGPLYGKMPGPDGPIFHRTAWDEALLTDLFLVTGFKDVRHWNWREVDHGIHDDHSQAYFPHMDKKNGRLLSLNLEASKP